MKKVGIIGGMGPLATADLFEKIIKYTDAKNDQDNIPVLIYSNPQIPDRTKAILNGGKSPVQPLVDTGLVLEKMGAQILCIPCNSAHYFHKQIQDKLDVKLLNMVELTVGNLKEKGYKRVAILGTLSTIKADIYGQYIRDTEIESVHISDELIDQLNYVIYDVVKANDFNKDIGEFLRLLNEMKEIFQVEAFVLACTELPILFERYRIELPSIDPTDILAWEIVKKAKENI